MGRRLHHHGRVHPPLLRRTPSRLMILRPTIASPFPRLVRKELMRLAKRPSWAVGALAAGASIAVTIGLATPARAALSGTDWTSVALSDSLAQGIADGPAVHPVSCVSGTTFCVAIVGDMDNIINGSDIGQAALVTTDAGQTWSTNVTLPSTVFPITALSCATTSVCWASGYSS